MGRKIRHGVLLLVLVMVAAIAYDWAFWYNYANLKIGDLPGFANAMDRYPTKEAVVGDLRKPFAAPEETDGRFAKAVKYAEQTESYALLIWQGGELLVERYWNGHDAELRPESASMHKSVLAMAVGLAIEDGHIESVDDPIKRYLPEWDGESRGEITVRNLLTMSSGLEPFPREDSPFSDYWKLAFGMRLEQLMLKLQPVRPQGEWFYYANTNSQLLGLVLERAIKMRYADYLSERLWRPLGADTAYVWLDRPNGMPRTFAAFLSRARDWLRLGLIIKNKGRMEDKQIIAEDWLDMMTRPSARNPNYGFQIWLSNKDVRKRYYNEGKTGVGFTISEPFLSDDLVYFDGFGGQRVFISRKDDYVIVRTGPPKLDWDEAVLPNIVVSGLATRGNTQDLRAVAQSWQ